MAKPDLPLRDLPTRMNDSVREKYLHKPLPPTPSSTQAICGSPSYTTDHHHNRPNAHKHVYESFNSTFHTRGCLQEALAHLRESVVVDDYPRLRHEMEHMCTLTRELRIGFVGLRGEYQTLMKSLKKRMDDYAAVHMLARSFEREIAAMMSDLGNWGENVEEKTKGRGAPDAQATNQERQKEARGDFVQHRGVGMIGAKTLRPGVQHKWRRKNDFVWVRGEESAADFHSKSRWRRLVDRVRDGREKLQEHARAWVAGVLEELNVREARAKHWYDEKVHGHERENTTRAH